MENKYNKIGHILGVDLGYIQKVDESLISITGKNDVAESINNELDQALEKLSGDLAAEIIATDEKLSAEYGNRLPQAVLRVYNPTNGFFIKKERAGELLETNRPQNLLDYFGYASVSELIEKEGFESVMSSLRFTQTDEWMHNFFDVAYGGLAANDFEEREVKVVILDPKWPAIAEKFLKKKLHNVSHLKEHGIIFVIPNFSDMPGETLRTLLLLLHYLHEVPFYSKLFRKFSGDSDFAVKLQSLLRGDVPNEKIEGDHLQTWRIVQRYLAKDNPDDFRLFEHHVNPEAEHWYLVGQDLKKVESELGITGISKWADTDWTDLNLIDLVMTMVKKGEVKYLYHRREAMWNRIFVGHFGRDRMNELIEENIIKGYIQL